MSIEINWPANGLPVCQWGTIDYPQPDPINDQVGHLLLAAASWLGFCEAASARGDRYGGDDWSWTATHDSGRTFVHLHYGDKRWTWEMFEAHWVDRPWERPGIYLGRWPD